MSTMQVLFVPIKLLQIFEEAVKSADAGLAAKWIMSDLNALANKHDVTLSECKVEAANFSTMIKISDGTISGKIAKEVLETIWETGRCIKNY